MWENVKELFRDNMQVCFYKKYLGVECLGCGMQRSILKLMEGDCVGSFKMYPPLFLILLTVSFLGLHLIFKFNKGRIILKYLSIITTIFALSNYLCKIV